MLYFSIFIISLLLIFSIGHFILSFFTNQQNENLNATIFTKIFIGLFSSVTVYSLIKTSFASINIGIILIAIIITIKEWKDIKLNQPARNFHFNKNEFYELTLLVLFCAPIFLWKYYCLFNHSEEYPIVINYDSMYHANIAQFLNQFGIESLNTNYF